MRACFIGCVASSLETLTVLTRMGALEMAGVITRKTAPYNADHVDLAPFCSAQGIPCFHAGPKMTAEALAFLRGALPDIIFCIGWSSLLPPEALAVAPAGVIGFHPAPLPLGRGRHPLIWALALGLRKTASTFFFMDEGADSGDIVSQRPVPITHSDTAATLYAKTLKTAAAQLRSFVPRLFQENPPRTPQDHSKATYWRKRGKNDGGIDFRMDAVAVYNLVRALSPPYPGAHCAHKGREIKIWQARPLADGDRHHEPGKVIAVEGRGVTVKCGQGSILLERHEWAELPPVGGYIA